MLDGFPCYRTGEFIRFSICSTRAGTFLSCASSTISDPESEDSTVVLLLNFCGIFQQNLVPSHLPKICLVDFLVNSPKHTKSEEIGGCPGVLGNYSISELKPCRNLTSSPAKNGSLGSFNSSL